jgi:hypothetical protein
MEHLLALFAHMAVSILVGVILLPLVLAGPLALVAVLLFSWKTAMRALWAFGLGLGAMTLYLVVLAVFSSSSLTDHVLGVVVMMVGFAPVFPLMSLAESMGSITPIPQDGILFLVPVLFAVLTTFVASAARRMRATPTGGDF